MLSWETSIELGFALLDFGTIANLILMWRVARRCRARLNRQRRILDARISMLERRLHGWEKSQDGPPDGASSGIEVSIAKMQQAGT